MQYFCPTSESEALELRSRLGSAARPLAGGTDLLPSIRIAGWPEAVISLRRVGWRWIDRQDGMIRIGAMVTASAVARQMTDTLPLLATAAAWVGGPQVRNAATIGGNVANGSPAADMALCLVVLDAELELVSVRGARKVPAARFFLGPKATDLAQDELLRSIMVPLPAGGSRAWFGKVGPRSRHFISRVAVAGIRAPSSPGSRVRIGLGAVAPTPVRAYRTEEFVQSRSELDEVDIEEAARIAAESDCAPIDDLRASATYRRQVVRHMVAQLLREVGS